MGCRASAMELVVGVHTCHPSSPKVETEGGEFKASPSYLVRACLKKRAPKLQVTHFSRVSTRVGVLFASHSID